MDKSLLCFYFARLDIFIDIDITFICWDEEVTVVNKDKHVENLLTEIHYVLEESDKVACFVLSHNFLLFDEASYDLVTLKLVPIVF